MKKQLSLVLVGLVCCGSLMAMGKRPPAPTLEDYRTKITNTDQEIIRLMAVRDGVVKKVGKYKKANKLDVYDPNREEELKKAHIAIAIQYDVSPKVVVDVFDAIITNSKNIESKA